MHLRKPEKPISRREREIALLVGQGLPNKEIAYRLGLTDGTVKVYVSGIFRKLDVSSRLELALLVHGRLRRPEPADSLAAHLAGGCAASGAD